MEITRTIIVLLAAICSANAFSKYGRTCKDIGCLPSETCIMAEDSCSYYQEKNKECGAYPTCKKAASINHSPGASAGSDHSRNNPYNNNNNNNYNNQYGQGNGYGGQSIDPNQIFGNPNSRPSQSNQPWKDLPIFAPNPTSGHSNQPQQPSGGIYSQAPNQYPSGGNSYPSGFAPPYQIPFAFGVPPPNSAHNIYPRPTTHQPSLLDQFLYNKQGGRRNAASTMHANWQQSTYIIIFSICNILAGFILTARNYH